MPIQFAIFKSPALSKPNPHLCIGVNITYFCMCLIQYACWQYLGVLALTFVITSLPFVTYWLAVGFWIWLLKCVADSGEWWGVLEMIFAMYKFITQDILSTTAYNKQPLSLVNCFSFKLNFWGFASISFCLPRWCPLTWPWSCALNFDFRVAFVMCL